MKGDAGDAFVLLLFIIVFMFGILFSLGAVGMFTPPFS